MLLLGFLVSCQSKTGTRLDPKAPKETYSRTAMEVRDEKYLSTVNVPVSISMKDVQQQINAQINGLIYEDNTFEDNNQDNFMVKVWKRQPILVTATGGADSLFHFTVPLKIWAKAGVKVLGFMQTQETQFEMDLRFSTRFSIDPDWAVSTQTKADGYEWITKPTIKLAGFNVPVTSLVGKMIDKNMGTVTQALDQQVRKQIDLKSQVLKAWNLIREPYLISEQYRTWLMVVPKRILITPLRFENNVIRSTIGIEGYTLTNVGARPDVKPAVTLPNLVVVPQVKDDFRIGLLSEASYEEAAKLAGQEFVGKSFSFKDGAYSITITDIDLYGQNENLIIKAGLKGSVTGDIYLRGRPYYDPATKSVSLKELVYDLETKSLLQRAASWLLQGTFAKTLEKNLTIPVGSQIDDMQKMLQLKLQNNQIAKGVVLNGRIDEIRPDQVYLTSSALLAVVYAKGRVDVKVDGLQ
nr:DUF4403 family protein [uncultured Arsenicibacter sp.]